MLFRQYLHHDPVVAISYFFGCGSRSQGVVVDPVEEAVDFYIEESKRLGMDIRYVIDTHLHADHISGARELAKKTGAAYVMHQSAATAFPFQSVEDGDEIVAGNTVIRILHTPGHTPEHISLVVTDRARGEDPWFIVTGHTLMVGDVGRTELASDVKAGAMQLYESLFQKILVLPDELEVYPGAYSGSVCGRSLSGKPSSTIGFEKKFNKALRLKEREAFVAFMTENIPEPPAGYQEIRAYNSGFQTNKP
ncbi:MBL fold metallo-hydrolase [Cohnella laeviribosi]|uniref:MBL fold metallo-hydrolase n=1 Tax=Cohnella laeviribosi TaxID=380174 RepID=UPI003D245D97